MSTHSTNAGMFLGPSIMMDGFHFGLRQIGYPAAAAIRIINLYTITVDASHKGVDSTTELVDASIIPCREYRAGYGHEHASVVY